MLISLFKAIHIVGFVSWFAALFFLGRLLVNYVETNSQPQPERDILKKSLSGMAHRLYKIIMNPAMMITWTAGIGMLVVPFVDKQYPNYLSSEVGTPGWMHAKLLLLVLLTGFHVWNKIALRKIENGSSTLSPFQLRLANEIPTVFLVAIVFIAVYGKAGTLNYAYLFAGVAAFAVLVYLGARAYKKRREANRSAKV
ncbi:MAG: CopD family protein [Saprospiraceae bacterium]